jgi:hypothetical protein
VTLSGMAGSRMGAWAQAELEKYGLGRHGPCLFLINACLPSPVRVIAGFSKFSDLTCSCIRPAPDAVYSVLSFLCILTACKSLLDSVILAFHHFASFMHLFKSMCALVTMQDTGTLLISLIPSFFIYF